MIIVLLPAYNEEESLPQILPKIKTVLENVGEAYQIIVGNDGSRDNTGPMLEEYARQMPLEIITHKINRGLGETSRDLFERASEIAADDDVIIRLDCDDTHEPEYMPIMIEAARSGSDVVIASRFAKGGDQKGVDGYRALISMCANLFMKFFFPISGVREYSCGYRAYGGSLIRNAIRFYGNDFIQLKGLGFTCTLEKLVKLKLLKARFKEVPFVLRYDQKRSNSKMVSSVTTLGYLVMVLLYYWPWGGWCQGYRKRLQEEIRGTHH